jgi:hypothetical protein
MEAEMKETKTVHLRKTVRPMRFLFLVPINNLDAVKQVVRINTALWGGYFNPITDIDQGNENILSLFKASHSDVIVNFADRHLSNLLLGLENYQVMNAVGFDGLLESEEGKYQFRYGCDMRPLMKYYWKEEGRFQSTITAEKNDSVYSYIEGDSDHWANYSLLEFGQYPIDHEYDYKNGYQKATNCTMIQISENNLSEIRANRLLSPLMFTLE